MMLRWSQSLPKEQMPARTQPQQGKLQGASSADSAQSQSGTKELRGTPQQDRCQATEKYLNMGFNLNLQKGGLKNEVPSMS